MSHIKNLFNPFYLLSLKSKKGTSKFLVTLWFIGHMIIILIYVIFVVVSAGYTFQKYNNTHLTFKDYGQIIKERYPEYNNFSDEDLGSLYIKKFQNKDLSKLDKQIILRDNTGRAYEIKAQSDLAYFGFPEINNILLGIQTNWEENVFQIVMATIVLEIFFVISNWIGLTLYKIWEN